MNTAELDRLEWRSLRGRIETIDDKLEALRRQLTEIRSIVDRIEAKKGEVSVP